MKNKDGKPSTGTQFPTVCKGGFGKKIQISSGPVLLNSVHKTAVTDVKNYPQRSFNCVHINQVTVTVLKGRTNMLPDH